MTNSISLGFISIFSFSLLDSFFIAQLGFKQLAAISYTFPVVFLLMNIFFGFNTGITAHISKAIGSDNIPSAQKLALSSILFIFILSVAIAIIGYYNIDSLFSLIGADDDLLVYINQYLTLWYLGSFLLMLTMATGAIIRGQGNAKIPSRIMLVAGIINGILDPFLIFGIGPFPRLEITGAVLATIISWIFACLASLYFLFTRTLLWNNNNSNNTNNTNNTNNIFDSNTEKTSFLNSIITYIKNLTFKFYFIDIKKILNISIPAIIANVMQPISSVVILKIVSLVGASAVAAFGVGFRLEAIASIFSISLSIAIIPFISINHGAKNYHRINIAFKYAIKYIFLLQTFIYLFFFAAAYRIAILFSAEPEVINTLTLYLRIIPGIYCFIGFLLLISSSLNAIEQAKYSTYISIIRFFVLTIPFVIIGKYLNGITGILIGIVCAKILSFIIALFIYNKVNIKFKYR